MRTVLKDESLLTRKIDGNLSYSPVDKLICIIHEDDIYLKELRKRQLKCIFLRVK